MIQISISNFITLSNLPPDRKNQIKQVLSIPNPAYNKILNITGNRYAAQAFFTYYKESKTDPTILMVPRGFRNRLLKWFEKINLPYSISQDLISIPIPSTLSTSLSTPTLKPHQEYLISQAIIQKDGVIEAGTGTGKTLCGLEIIRRLNQTALILVHNSILLNQFIKEAKDFYNWDIGQIGDGKKDIKQVSVATWQSLSADTELLTTLAKQTSVIIVDECQGIVSSDRMATLRSFKPSHIFGLTGTAFRSSDDGRSKAIHFLTGEIVASHRETMIKPTVEIIYSRVQLPWYGDYHQLADDLASHQSRNSMITSLAIGEAVSGKRVIILCKLRKHCELLYDRLKGLNTFYADSDDPQRNEVLLKMRKNEHPFSILIGTFSLLSAGLDIPSLDVLIIGADVKSEVILEQSSGRILRLFEGKEEAKIYDIKDENPILYNQFKNRVKVYKSKGWEIKGWY